MHNIAELCRSKCWLKYICTVATEAHQRFPPLPALRLPPPRQRRTTPRPQSTAAASRRRRRLRQRRGLARAMSRVLQSRWRAAAVAAAAVTRQPLLTPPVPLTRTERGRAMEGPPAWGGVFCFQPPYHHTAAGVDCSGIFSFFFLVPCCDIQFFFTLG